MTAIIITVSVILGILAISLTVSYVCYRMAFHSPKKNQGDPHAFPNDGPYEHLRERTYNMVEALLAIPYESVFIKSHDGLTLHARYYHQKDGAPLAIGLHGYRSTSIRDFCGGGPLALDMGFNLLLVDQRAHGKSEGHAITFGINERRDCLSWINWACERFGSSTPIMLYGVSMGAATVLMVSGMDLPDNVRLGIADCPYSSPVAIISKVARDMHYPARLMYPFVWLGARIFGGFNIAEMTAARAVANAKIPLMIIHGECDDFVPSSMSDEAVTANPKITKHTFPDAGHALSYMYDTERYQRLVREFISKNISNTNI